MKKLNKLLSMVLSFVLMFGMIMPIESFAESMTTINVLKDASYTLPENIIWDTTDTTVDTSNIGYHIFNGEDTEGNQVTYRINVGEYVPVFEDNLESYENNSTVISSSLSDGGTFTMTADNRKIVEDNGNKVLAVGPDASAWNTLSWAPKTAITDDFKLSFKMKVAQYVLDGVHTSDSKHLMTRVNVGGSSSKSDLFQMRMQTKGKDQKTYNYTDIRLVGKDSEGTTSFNINLDEILGQDVVKYTDSTDENGNVVKSMDNWLTFDFYGNKDKYTLYINDVLIKEDLEWANLNALSKGFKHLGFAKRDGVNISNAITYTDDVILSKFAYIEGELPEELNDTVELGENHALERTQTISLLLSNGTYKNFIASYKVDTTVVGENVVQATVEGFYEDGVQKTIPVKVSVEQAPVVIESISDIIKNVVIGESFTLPETVIAEMSDGTQKEQPVVWDSTPDTTNVGTYEFYGDVLGYSGKVKLTLNVKNAAKREEHVAIGESFYLPESLDGKAITWEESDFADIDGKVDTSTFGRLNFIGTDSDNTEIFYTIYVSRAKEIFNDDMQSYATDTRVETTEPPYYITLDGQTSMIKQDGENKAALMLPTCTFGNFSVVSENKTTTDYSFKGRIKIDGDEKNAGIRFILYNVAGKETSGINFSLDDNTSLIRMRNGVRASVKDGGNPTTIDAQNTNYLLFENEGEWLDFEVFVDVHNKNYDVYSNGYLIRKDLDFNIPNLEDGCFKSAKAFSLTSSISTENKVYVDDLTLTEYTYVTEALPEKLTDSVTKGADANREQQIMLTLNDGSREAFTVKYTLDMSQGGKQEVNGTIDGFSDKILVEADVDLREIKSIENITDTAFVGANYKLPEKVNAVMTDDSSKEVTVTWDSVPDTSLSGIYEITGTVSGYDGSMKLILTVVNDYPVSVEPIVKELGRYEKFSLPEKVTANMLGGGTRELKVDWLGQIARTDIVGTFTHTGYIVGYQPDVSDSPVSVTLTLKINPVKITGFRNATPDILLKRGADMPEKIVCTYENGMMGFEKVIWDEAALGDGSLDSYTVTGTVDGFPEKVTATVNFVDVPKPNLVDGMDTAKWDFGDEMYLVGSRLVYGVWATSNSAHLNCAEDPENPENRVVRYINSPDFEDKWNGIYATLAAEQAKGGIAMMDANIYLPREYDDYFRIRLQSSSNYPYAAVDLYSEDQRIKDVNCAFPVEEWFRLTIVTDSNDITNQTYDLYIDGTLILEDAPWTTKPSETNNVGKNVQKVSFICGDEDFVAYVDEINVYMLNDTFTSAIESISFDSLVADNNLELPTSYSDGTVISWSSSDEATIATDGTVTRPPYGSKVRTVILTATLTKDMGCLEAKETKEFAFTVKPLGATDEDIVEEVAKSLNIPSIITDDVELKTSTHGVNITWETSNPEILDSKGRVFNPAEDTIVTITATIKYGDKTETKIFKSTVKHSEEVSDKQKVRAAMKSVSLPAETDKNLSLPDSADGVDISWISNNISVISHKGVLASKRGQTDVIMTAVFSLGDYRDEQSYTITVKASKSDNGGSGGGSSSGGNDDYKSNAVQTTPTIPQTPVVNIAIFNDISDYTWAEEAINSLAKANIINGISENLFAPGKEILREEFAAMMTRLVEYESNNTESVFEDVSENDWFFSELNAAYENGLISGIGNNRFGVGMPISRQDMAVILYNTAKKSGFTPEDAAPAKFSDYESVADYAKEAVDFLYSMKIVNGSEGKMLPHQNATRAEAAKMIYEFLKIFYSDKLN